MIGENIKYYREVENFTQDSLAKKLNVAKNTVSAWERNVRMPTRENINALLDIFLCTEYELFCRRYPNDMIAKSIDEFLQLSESDRFTVMSLISKLSEKKAQP